jgi:hypothetical protein
LQSAFKVLDTEVETSVSKVITLQLEEHLKQQE